MEHRLFSFLSAHWRGEPLHDYETIVHLIARTTTAKGLQVLCRLDRRKYATGRRISDEEMKRISLEPHRFHGDWNYVIRAASHPSPRGNSIYLFVYGYLVTTVADATDGC